MSWNNLNLVNVLSRHILVHDIQISHPVIVWLWKPRTTKLTSSNVNKELIKNNFWELVIFWPKALWFWRTWTTPTCNNHNTYSSRYRFSQLFLTVPLSSQCSITDSTVTFYLIHQSLYCYHYYSLYHCSVCLENVHMN